MAAPVYSLQGVEKQWGEPETGFRLIVPDLTIAPGEQVAVTGVSGSGKSTLLDMLGLVLSPSGSGAFTFAPPGVAAADIAACWQDDRHDAMAALRRDHVGYILQTGALLPFLSVRENVSLSCRIRGEAEPGVVEHLTERLGIARHLAKMPSALSIGERQRVAIARALAHRPAVIIADEPTASLDPETSGVIMDLFLDIAAERGTTLIVSSHDWDRIRALGFRCLVPEVAGRTATVTG